MKLITPVKRKSIRISPAAGSHAALEFRSVTQSVDEAIVIGMHLSKQPVTFWIRQASTQINEGRQLPSA